MPGPDSDERLRVYERILASSRDHLSLVDRDYVYRLVNDAYVSVHGRRRDQIEGRHVADILGPETFEELVRPRLDRALAGEVVEYEGTFDFMAAGRLAMSVAYFPYRGHDDSEVTGVLVRATDITRERAMQADLREQDERLALFLEVSGVGTWDWSVDDDRITWSPRVYELCGITEESFDGTFDSFLKLLEPDDRNELAARVARSLDDTTPGSTYEAEYRIVRQDGSARWHSARGAVLRHADGRPRRMLGIVSDVTERKSLEAQLSHSRKLEALGGLAGGIAHDFNNVLTAIVGSAAFGRRATSREDTARAFGIIDEAAMRATSLVRALLTFARAQPNDPRVVDLSALVRGLEDMLVLSLPETIQLRLPPVSSAPLLARIDPAQLEQVILNLVVNAKDAMPSGGRLTIAVGRDADAVGAEVWIDVRDEGVGIPPELHSRVFEPFFTTKPAGAGTGLGLATCHGVIDRAGGTIRLSSAPGKGTTVTVRLPEVAGPITRAPRRGDEGVPVGDGERVALVEDDPTVRLTLERLCVDLGYTVRTFADGAVALAAIGSDEGIALVITDVMMPGLGGPELVRALRESRPTLPVIFMSGYARELGDLEGDARFLPKPFTRAELAEAIRDAIG